MPTTADHLQRAQENEEFFATRLDIRAAVDRPWMVTSLFYAAVHWVDAYLGLQNIHPGTHIKRNGQFAQDPQLAPLYTDYEELSQRSRDARYNCIAFTDHDVRWLCANRYLPFRQGIVQLLAPTLAAPVRPSPPVP